MSKKTVKSKQEYTQLYSELVDSTKLHSRNKFLRKKAKNKDKKRAKYDNWD